MKHTFLMALLLWAALLSSAQSVTPGGNSGFANPMTQPGDLIDGATAGAPQRLAGCASGVLVYSALSLPGCSSTLPSGVNATTQAVGDTSTHIATDAFVCQNAACPISVLTSTTDQLAAATISTTQTAFASSPTIPANQLVTNQGVRVTYVFGLTTSSSATTMRFRLYLGGS